MGWIVTLIYPCLLGTSEWDLIQKWGLCNYTQVNKKPHWIAVGLNPVTHVLTRRWAICTKSYTGRTWQRQRLALCCSKPWDTKDCWQPPDARRKAWNRFSSWASKKELTLLAFWFWTFGLPSCERVYFCCFNQQVSSDSLGQLGETNTAGSCQIEQDLFSICPLPNDLWSHSFSTHGWYSSQVLKGTNYLIFIWLKLYPAYCNNKILKNQYKSKLFPRHHLESTVGWEACTGVLDV